MIKVDKATNPAGSTVKFGFDASWLTDDPPAGDADFELADGDALFESAYLVQGSYTVAELVPDGWDLDSIEFFTSDGTDTSSSLDATATVDLDPGETITVKFTDSTGAILITKTTKKYGETTDPGLAGVTFDIYLELEGDDEFVATGTTAADGTLCFGGLTVGDSYRLEETSAPAGYTADAVETGVVAAAAECSGEGTPTGVSISNDPLSKLTITFESLAGDRVTVVDAVSCVGLEGSYSSGPLLGEGEVLDNKLTSNSVFITDLLEGQYVCTINIDP
jgi:hypothetical protein